jgi:hypothetical protein
MLVSLEDIKTYLALSTTTYDDLLTILEESAEGFIEGYCNNKILTSEETQYFNGDDCYLDGLFFLNNNINLSSLVLYEFNGISWNVIDSDDYVFDDKGGFISYSYAVSGGKRNYKATYTCGYTTGIPNALKLAILKIVGKYYNKHKSDGITDENLDGAGITFEKFMSDDIKLVLDKYKLTVI